VILLDTHILIWTAASPERLTRRAANAIRRAERSSGLAIASITLWEVAFLFWKGRLRHRGTVEQSLRHVLEMTRVAIKEITPEIAILAQQFSPPFPSDPQDRLIAATAIAEGLPLVTADDAIRASPRLRTIW
jgi:PIN domain nuclease of toxin-antitoxin system